MTDEGRKEMVINQLRLMGYAGPEAVYEHMAVIAALVKENYDEDGNPRVAH